MLIQSSLCYLSYNMLCFYIMIFESLFASMIYENSTHLILHIDMYYNIYNYK